MATDTYGGIWVTWRDEIDGGIYVCKGGLHDVEEKRNDSEMPIDMSLSCSPNPFSDRTSIIYTLSDDCRVKLKIFSITGEFSAILEDGKKPPGIHRVTWNAEVNNIKLPQGIYIGLLDSQDQITTQKILLIE